MVLLDDPLSAVDAHVGQHLWANCVCGLLANRMTPVWVQLAPHQQTEKEGHLHPVRGERVFASLLHSNTIW